MVISGTTAAILSALAATGGIAGGYAIQKKQEEKEEAKKRKAGRFSIEFVDSFLGEQPFWKQLSEADRKAIIEEYLNAGLSYSDVIDDFRDLSDFTESAPDTALNFSEYWDQAEEDITAEDEALLELLESDRDSIIGNADEEYLRLMGDGNGNKGIFATTLDDTYTRLEQAYADTLANLGDTRDTRLELLQNNLDTTLADIAAEGEAQRAILNSQLARTGDAYTDARNAVLSSQHQRNAQTMGTMVADMQNSRRNAIEAGASAGVRIAGNVNALLSAQNKMAQQSLDTSNQLAQMLVNQRNAEAGITGQWMEGESNRGSQRRGAQNAYTQGAAGAHDAYSTGRIAAGNVRDTGIINARNTYDSNVASAIANKNAAYATANSGYTSGYLTHATNRPQRVSALADMYYNNALNANRDTYADWDKRFNKHVGSTNMLRGRYYSYLGGGAY